MTTTISSVTGTTVAPVGKIFGVSQVRGIGSDSTQSFQGMLEKSQQSDKSVSMKKQEVRENNDKPIAGASEKKGEAKADKALTKEKAIVDEKQTARQSKESKETEETTETDQTECNPAEQKKIKEFVEKVQKTLGLTPEEMEKWLAQLGMTVMDLFEPAKLQNFFMQTKGIDVSELLTVPSTTGQLKELLADAATVKQEVQKGMERTNPEADFRALLEKVFGQETESEITSILTEQKDRSLPTPTTPFQENEFAGKETAQEKGTVSKSEDLFPREVLPEAFQKVVQTEERWLVTENGLERVVTTVTAKDVFEQIVTKFTAQTIGDTSKLTVQLNPEHLGKVAFQVVSRDGQMTGHFVAENEAVKSALEAQLSQLKVHLIDQGVRVSDVKVVVGDTVNYFADDKPKEQNQETAKKKTRRVHAIETMPVEEEATPIAEINTGTGTVNLMA